MCLMGRLWPVWLVIAGLWAGDAGGEEKPFGLEKRVPWTSSRVVGTPEPPPPYRAARAFGQLKFDHPVYVTQEPGTGRFLVGELSGKIFAFTSETPDTTSRELYLDIGPNRELYAFSFHPRYAENGVLFVFSTDTGKLEKKQNHVSRFTASQTHPRSCLADSEQMIVEWPAGGHSGGEAIIGPDGYLYVSTGDGTSGSDVNNTGQGVNDLFSVIMRLDVDHPEAGKPYGIPPDNPFANYPGARPEIWAHGFRNPWRLSFDPAGRLWVGDVGQDLWEMIWLVERGGNYGWSVQEGTHPFHPHKVPGPGPILPPVVEHHHTECRSITGGYVYQGDKFPELRDVYVYGDYEYGKIWGVRHDGQQVTWHQELADTPLRIASFGVTRDGDILMVEHMAGELYQLERSPEVAADRTFPRKLSETGIFSSVADHQVAPGVVSYSVNTPQWLDGAMKERFICLPGESQIKFVEHSSDANTWGFEDGAVLIETISLEMAAGDPGSRRRLETRLLVKQENHWLGYAYLWNDEQTDAALVEARGRDLTLNIKDASGPGGQREQTWHVPSRSECMVCHSRAAGFVLGLNTLQVNRDHDYGGAVDNQLRALNHAEYFTQPLDKQPAEYSRMPNAYDPSADLAERARAYLHVNCSVCHVADGGGNAKFKVTYRTPTAETQLVGEPPIHGTFGLSDARLIAPSDPYASVLFYRLSKLGRGRMPHVGSSQTDEQGLELIHEWIASLPKPEGPPAPALPSYNATLVALRDCAAAAATERATVIDGLLSSTREALVLTRTVAREALPKALREEVIARSLAHPDVNVRDLFERFVPPSQRIKRLGDSVDPQEILALSGNAESGRRFFFSDAASQCKNCHRVQGQGGTLGPDLSEIAKRYQRHELLESLLEPSKKIDPKFATHTLLTSAGQVYTGILVEKSDSHVVLNVLRGTESELLRLPVAEMEDLQPQPVSLMPDRLLRELTPQQAADLLEFLWSLKGGE